MEYKTSREYILAYNQLLKECDTIYHNAAMKAGLSDCAFWILYTLHDIEKTYTQSEICDDGFMPRQTVNSALKKLERDGYLTLHRTAGKMGKSIQLTEKGQQLAKQKILPIMHAEDQACLQFTAEEKNDFLTTFRTLVNRLKCEVEKELQEENE